MGEYMNKYIIEQIISWKKNRKYVNEKMGGICVFSIWYGIWYLVMNGWYLVGLSVVIHASKEKTTIILHNIENDKNGK